MNKPIWHDEPERCELNEPPRYRFSLTRRAFVQVVGAGLLVTTSGLSWGQRRGGGESPGIQRFHFADDGTVTLFTGKVQVGQGSRTQLAQAAAEELRIPLNRIQVVMADTDRVPDDGGTYGSQTTPRTVPTVRHAAAEAREELVALACEHWGVGREGAAMNEGIVEHPDGKRISLAELVKAVVDVNDRVKFEASNDVPLTAQRQWAVLGTSPDKFNAVDVVTGTHRYPYDIKLPGMVYGAMVRAPSYNATLTSVDTSAVANGNGVEVVHEGEFLGCTAPTCKAARNARNALAENAIWETAPHPASSSLFSYLREHTQEGSGRYRRREQQEGDVDAAMKEAVQTHKATFEVPYVQHAPMEPRAAVARWDGDRLTVWTGTQRPFGVQEELAEAFRMPMSKVRVIVPDTGGGFGGKHTGDAAVEAARLAKGVGKPVAVQWSREEEFTWAYFRPAALIDIAAAFDGDGNVTTWDYTNFNSGTSGIDCPYTFANQRIRFQPCESPLRAGSYRALAATANNFAREAFIDQLAATAKQDPVAFRDRYLPDGRLKNVLHAAADAFGWRDTLERPAGATGIGIACGTEKGSYVATCAEVAIESGAKLPTITRITVAFDCGPVMNPKNLRAQIVGGVIMGLGAVLREEMVFESGRIQNDNFKNYRVPRFKDVPPIDVVIVERNDVDAAGAGETPIIALAPAVANAVFHVTGNAPSAIPIRV